MKDLTIEKNAFSIAFSDYEHIEALIGMQRGWNRFYPDRGAGIVMEIHNQSKEEILRRIRREIERDGADIERLQFINNDIDIEARYTTH